MYMKMGGGWAHLIIHAKKKNREKFWCGFFYFNKNDIAKIS